MGSYGCIRICYLCIDDNIYNNVNLFLTRHYRGTPGPETPWLRITGQAGENKAFLA